jgi:hypothetical protein
MDDIEMAIGDGIKLAWEDGGSTNGLSHGKAPVEVSDHIGRTEAYPWLVKLPSMITIHNQT